MDVLAISFGRAVEQGLVTGLAKHQKEGDVAILQYADDTILLFQDDLAQARHVKMILGMFELMSGLKINFHKSGVICVGMEEDRIKKFEEILTCGRGVFPIKYLGIHVDEKRLKNSVWNPSVEKMEKIMGGWLGRFLNIAGRTSLINSSLTSLTLFMLSFYGLPKGIKKKYDRPRASFLWSGEKEKLKYHLVAWNVVCRPKELGGLGILDLEIMNIALLAKRLWKLFNVEGLWQKILWDKYVGSSTLGQVQLKQGDSHFWQGLLKIKELFLSCCKFCAGNGKKNYVLGR